jgi:hypothetical protein
MLDPLRQRFCSRLECRAMFFICRSCDRGQRYCGDACRQLVRSQQRRDASRRFQQSADGRFNHRLNQRAYRKRRAQRRRSDMQYKETVTDQGSAPMLAMAISVRLIVACARLSGFDLSIPPTTKALPVIELSLTCHCCGRRGHFIETWRR